MWIERTQGRRVIRTIGYGQPRADLPCVRMIDSELRLGKRLFLDAVIQHAADVAVQPWPNREASEWFIVKARHDQGLLREFAGDVGRQAKEVGAGDDCIELAAPLPQRVD